MLYLKERGFELVGKNVYVGKCEIDVIVKNEELLLFVEVKTRRQRPDVRSVYGRPASAVNHTKKQNVLSAAKQFLREHSEEIAGLQPRADIIEVYVDPSSEAYRVLEIKHFPGAISK